MILKKRYRLILTNKLKKIIYLIMKFQIALLIFHQRNKKKVRLLLKLKISMQ